MCRTNSRRGIPTWNKGIPMGNEAKLKSSVSHKGQHSSPETEFKKGNIPYSKGFNLSKEHREKLSMNHWDCSGKSHPMYIDGNGKKRRNAKRRELGFDPINEPTSDDMVAHHITKEYVAYIPEFINKSCRHNVCTEKNMGEVNFYTLNYLFLIYNK